MVHKVHKLLGPALGCCGRPGGCSPVPSLPCRGKNVRPQPQGTIQRRHAFDCQSPGSGEGMKLYIWCLCPRQVLQGYGALLSLPPAHPPHLWAPLS